MSKVSVWRDCICATAVVFVMFVWSFGEVKAQEWPSKSMTMIMPLPAGGATDAIMRMVAREMGRILGQPVIVENRTGAAGRIGLGALARAPRDGYTFGVVTSGPLIAVPASSKIVPYDPIKDFTHLAMLCETYATWLMSPTVPVNSMKELVAYARANPGRLNYGSIGNGSVAHFFTEHWRRSINIELEHIPYAGEPQAVQDLLAGRLQLYMSPTPYVDLVASGKLKALVSTGPRRTAKQPDVPTMGESGYPEATWSVLFGLAGPADLPAAIAQRLSNAALEAIKVPSVVQRLTEFGYSVRPEGAAEMLVTVQAELAQFRRIAAATGISVD